MYLGLRFASLSSLVWLLAVSFFFNRCEEKKPSSTNTLFLQRELVDPYPSLLLDLEDSVPILEVTQLLQDSILTIRDRALRAEQEKFSNVTVFIDELKNSIGSSEAMAYASQLQLFLDTAQQHTYDTTTMGDLRAMETYDQFSLNLVNIMIDTRQAIPELENHKRATLAHDDFIDLDEADFELRKQFNEYAMAYNYLVTKFGLAKERYPLFYGEEDQAT